MSQKIKLVVIGNGPVGHNFLEYLVESGQSDKYQVTVFGEEPIPAYDRVHLTSWFKNQDVADINMVTEGFYPSNNFTLHSGDKVTQIDRFKRVITSEAGLEVSYDKIILATGSFPFVPPVPGHDRDNVFVYRTIDDLEKITAAAKTGKVGAVIGLIREKRAIDRHFRYDFRAQGFVALCVKRISFGAENGFSLLLGNRKFSVTINNINEFLSCLMLFWQAIKLCK